MAEHTNIAWTDSSFNPAIGCTKVSPGCDHCYAEVSTPSRAMKIVWGPGSPRHRTSESAWAHPRAWNKKAERFKAQHGRRQRVFCASLADVFDNEWDPKWRSDLWTLIRETQELDWQILTKRIGNVIDMLPDDWGPNGYPNVQLGSTVVNQPEADRDIAKLLATPARGRFLSLEPLLQCVDLTSHLWGRAVECVDCSRDADCECGWKPRNRIAGEPALNWVIVGGESGSDARQFDVAWARSIVKQCADADVACFVKQLGANVVTSGCTSPGQHWPDGGKLEDTGRGYFRKPLVDKKGGDWLEWGEDLRVRQFPEQRA